MQPAKQQRKKKEKIPAEQVEPSRRSERPRKEVSYCEFDKPVRKRVAVDHSQRIAVGCLTKQLNDCSSALFDRTARLQAVALDSETAEKLRAEMESKRSTTSKGGKGRGPIDSGKGVRIQVGPAGCKPGSQWQQTVHCCCSCSVQCWRDLCAGSKPISPLLLVPCRVAASMTPSTE